MRSTVKDVMSTHVIAVKPSAPYKEMATMLHEQRVSAFPVIDDDDKVIGVVSETDMLAKEALDGTVPRSMDLSLARPAVTIGADEPVTRAARLMFDQRVTVTVKNGIVTIEGAPETSRAGHDIIDAVRHIEGVVFVRDRLSCPGDSPDHLRVTR